MNCRSQVIAILGAGKSGLSAARLALKNGCRPHVFDSSAQAPAGWPEDIPLTSSATEAEGNSYRADIVVISPGMEAGSPFVQSFCRENTELIGEVEFASRFYKGTIIAITGTNGKTTTTELIERILLQDGKQAKACGNYGYAFSEVALMEPQPDFAVLEVSSFQLETIREFHPHVAIWLNFAPDHMDRYRSIDEYRHAKLRIFENQDSRDLAIIREGEDISPGRVPLVTFSSEKENATLYYKDHCIYENGMPLLSLEETKMNVKHNAENVMAALLATRSVGVSLDSVKATLARFAPPLHRCELVSILDGVEYLNDSKATNIHALDNALRSQTKPVVLIAGGKDKGLDYSILTPRLREKVKVAVVFGEIGTLLHNTFHTTIKTLQAESLETAVIKAQELASPGDVVLFSPGTSSFDMFTGYEQRGDVFRHTVNHLKHHPTQLK